jgi:NADH:ubiquinone oxidoreductase subunit 6 (subunit J)
VSTIAAVALVIIVSLAGIAAGLPGRSSAGGVLAFGIALCALSGIFVLSGAHFVAVAQLIASLSFTLVLFLIVSMLEGRRGSRVPGPDRVHSRMGLVGMGGGLALALLFALMEVLPSAGAPFVDTPEGFGGYRAIASLLFEEYSLLVVAIGFLLLAGLLGAGLVSGRGLDR